MSFSYYRNSFSMFQGKQVGDFLAGRIKNVQNAIQQAEEIYILNINEEEYISYLIMQYSIDTPYIDFDNVFVDQYEKQVPAERFPQDLYVIPGKLYLKQVIVYHLPFTGDAELFRCTPRQYQLSFPLVFIDNQNVGFEFINYRNDPEEIKREAQRIIDSIKFFLSHLTQEVEEYNAGLRGTIEGIVKSRKQKLLDNHNLLASLGVPVKKRDDLPETFAIPFTQVKKFLLVKPKVISQESTPELLLDMSVYQEILKVIHETGKVFERYPSTYEHKGEEDLRDYLLLLLTPHLVSKGL